MKRALGLAALGLLLALPPLLIGPVGWLAGERRFFLLLHLPRLLTAALTGVLLSCSGLILQTLFRNRLADPFTLGVSGGAALGVGLGVLLGVERLGALALVGGIMPILFLLGLARRLPERSESLLVAGIGLTATTAALLLLVQYLLPGGDALRLLFWMMGDLSVVGYEAPATLLVNALLVSSYLFLRRRELDLLLEGEEIASARGLETKRFRAECVIAASWAAAVTVAAVGPIFFVGLLVPNLVRARVGAGHAALLPATAFLGFFALPWCDLAARLLSPTPIPIGVTTALLGGPFLLWSVLRR